MHIKNNIMFCSYMYKIYIYIYIVYNFKRILYLHMIFKKLLNYYFIYLCHIVNRPNLGLDKFINLSCINL